MHEDAPHATIIRLRPFDFLAFGKAGASHILLDGRARASVIKQEIESGKISFAAAAKQYSKCPSGAKGGELGTFAPGDMVRSASSSLRVSARECVRVCRACHPSIRTNPHLSSYVHVRMRMHVAHAS